MARKKIVKSVYIEADQHDALRALSEATGISVAEYIREGIARVLRSGRQMGLIGAPIIADGERPQ